MAEVHLKSGNITSRDATPRVKGASSIAGGVMHGTRGTLEATAADDIASTYRFCQVPSNCVVSQVLVYADDQGTAGDMDIGIYQTTENGGAVVDADHFAAAVDLNAAALHGYDATHRSSANGMEEAEKPLWQALGLTSDPCRMYDVVGTLTEANSAGATITVKVSYTV